ncbi:type III effector HrpK domain-containing protein [Pseudomonas sp. LRF_L74]|uniref:type III effector HrpK domain-containing protein n=1 Tax=Pseudomonas sp. LRF_L74 TaxID=3369422 RepID=UPI003F6120F9
MGKVTAKENTAVESELGLSTIEAIWNNTVLVAKQKSDSGSGDDKQDNKLSAEEKQNRANEYANTILDNYDTIKGDHKYITRDDLVEYKKSHSDLDPELSDALSFWSQEDVFKRLDTSKHGGDSDGDVSKNDLKSWVKGDAGKDIPDTFFQFSGNEKTSDDYDNRILDNFDKINVRGDYLTLDEIRDYRSSDSALNEALAFWSQEDAFKRLDTFADGGDVDGKVSKSDLQDWIEQDSSDGLSNELFQNTDKQYESAREQAEKLGIVWERPDGDNRSAKYILENSKLLSDLGNQEGLRDSLKERVGDYEHDADAAFRAVQVLEHIERFDADGKALSGTTVGNERIDGVTPNGDVKHGTEAGRLKDFGKYGFDSLKGDLGKRTAAYKDPKTREAAEDKGIKWQRAENDKRSAKDIIDDTPALKDIEGKKDIESLLKDQVGDYKNDADAAYRAAQVIEHVQRFDGEGKAIVGKDAGNGKIDGFTSSDEARHNTEAGRLQDFGKNGFDSLNGKLVDRSKVGEDKEARAEAEKKGIKWERPEGDERSAQDIIEENPLLAGLGNQSGVKDMLKDRVGDYEHDADAAYRAAQVLEHIERFDSGGQSIVGKDVGNDKIDGFKDEEATGKSEARRLQDFGKNGFKSLNGKLADTDAPKNDADARKKAEEKGIEWERPQGDKRSADDILKDNPLLKDLENQSGVKDMLKDQVGDYEKDADAAYRAVQVLEHIERLDRDGKVIAGNSVDNGKIDGFKGNEAQHDSEAGRLQDFGKHGFDSLEGKLVDRDAVGKDSEARKQAEALGITWERLDGDERRAREIIQDTPVLRDLGNQSGVKDMLKDRVGDYEKDADAAWRAAQVLEHIETFDSKGKKQSGDKADNGKIDDFTPDNEARPDSEAGRLQDFGKNGFGALKGKLESREGEKGEPVADEKKAREQAEKLGIDWERPQGDTRRVDEILEENPLLKELTNDEDVKDMLKERVGDFEKDADAAYRAVQVLEHIERFDGEGKSLVGKDVGNDKVDGFTDSGQARHGTEAGRLKDFGKYGFEHLNGNLKDRSSVGEDKEARAKAEAKGIVWERPEGDGRTASEIINQTPALKELKNDSGVRDLLKDQVGDFEKDADAAYRAAQVIEHVQRFDGEGKSIVGKSAGDGRIDGFSSSGEARENTEAARLQDFGKNGFDSLKGKIADRSKAGNDQQAREDAEKLGIKWQRPEDDQRSASEIKEDSPLLRDLNNQSGTRDMLKDRVGDFDNDADAAYRAVQVLEYIENFSNSGRYNNEGGKTGNGKIDGFTSSGEAQNGSEAGRLQDFGKYGFSALEHTSGKYQDFEKNNPDADAASLKIAEYAATLHENFDAIRDATDAGQFLRVSDLQKFKEQNPDLPDEVKEAIDFWSNPGAFELLETSVDKMRYASDGLLTKEDIGNWIGKEAPKDATSALQFLARASQGSSVDGVDTAKIGPEIFDNPDRYSAKEKAAVVQDLQEAYALVMMGESSGMWKEDHIVKKLKDRAGVGDDPQALMQDIQSHIDQLAGDSEVIKYLEEAGANSMKSLVGNIPGMKESLEKTYKDDILSGKALDSIWEKNSKKEGATKTEALIEFYNLATSSQAALGVEDTKGIQDAVGKSKIGKDLENYYKDEIVTGKRLDQLMEKSKPEEALSAFSMEVALFNATLPADVTAQYDDTLSELVADKTSEVLENELTFDDLKKAYGENGSDKLDEEKVLAIFEQVKEDTPELLVTEAGTQMTRDQFLTAMRGSWDMMRQGTKVGTKAEWLTEGALKNLSDRGVMHAVSGLFLAGLTISKGVAAGANMTPRAAADIAISSIQTTAVLTEGGAKGYGQFIKNVESAVNANGTRIEFKPDVAKNLARIENYAKIGGGVAGIAGGVLGIIDGVKAIRTGDKLGGGLTITSSGLGALAGLAATVEGGLGLAGLAGSTVPIIAGSLGFAAAGAGVLAAGVTFVMIAIQQSEQSSRENDYADLLGAHLEKYGITGKG